MSKGKRDHTGGSYRDGQERHRCNDGNGKDWGEGKNDNTDGER